jgi:hypothetical protein
LSKGWKVVKMWVVPHSDKKLILICAMNRAIIDILEGYNDLLF